MSEVLGDKGKNVLRPGATVVEVILRHGRHVEQVASHCLIHLVSPLPNCLTPSLDGTNRHAVPLRHAPGRPALIPLLPAPLHDLSG